MIVTRATWPESTHTTNSLKLTGSSLRWNFDEKFQTSATRTIIATQKTTLFTVVLNTASRRSCGAPAIQSLHLGVHSPQGQDYHAGCEGSDPKRVSQYLTRYPHNVALLSSDDGD